MGRVHVQAYRGGNHMDSAYGRALLGVQAHYQNMDVS
jgi:hypothetical protein